jgi:hypothetical protein
VRVVLVAVLLFASLLCAFCASLCLLIAAPRNESWLRDSAVVRSEWRKETVGRLSLLKS